MSRKPLIVTLALCFGGLLIFHHANAQTTGQEKPQKVVSCEVFLSDKTYDEIKTIGKKRPGWINPAEEMSFRGDSFAVNLELEEFSMNVVAITTFRPSLLSATIRKRTFMTLSLHGWKTMEVHETEYEKGDSVEYVTIYGRRGDTGKETYRLIEKRHKIEQ